MATVHTIVNTDLLSATDDRSRMRSFRYGTWDATKKELTGKDVDNGSVLLLNNEMLDRDLWVAVDPAADSPLDDLVLVTTPEIMYDERQKNLNEFYNEAGTNCTGMILKAGDVFSETAEGFDGTPTLGAKVTVQAGPTFKIGGTGTQVGIITDIWVHNKDTYYAVLVKPAAN